MFKFSIREILLATTIAAMALAWHVDRTALAAKAAAGEEAIEDARTLALLTSAPRGMLCGQAVFTVVRLQEKYGANTGLKIEWPEDEISQ